MEIGEKILHYRTLCGMTQEQVANKLQTTPQNIYKYEKGIIKNIPLQSIVIMSELFGVSPAELAGIAEPTSAAASSTPPSAEKLAFGVRLRSRREECGLSVRELAIKLHILPSIVEGYESGNFNTIDDFRLNKIAEILNVKPEYFSEADLSEATKELKLTDEERLLIIKYRKNPHYHSAIRQLLGISPHDTADSDSNSFSYPELSASDYDELQTRAQIAQNIGEYRTDKKDD
jgi:transcriptional regulator with XRE-family HTH domain